MKTSLQWLHLHTLNKMLTGTELLKKKVKNKKNVHFSLFQKALSGLKRKKKNHIYCCSKGYMRDQEALESIVWLVVD